MTRWQIREPAGREGTLPFLHRKSLNFSKQFLSLVCVIEGHCQCSGKLSQRSTVGWGSPPLACLLISVVQMPRQRQILSYQLDVTEHRSGKLHPMSSPSASKPISVPHASQALWAPRRIRHLPGLWWTHSLDEKRNKKPLKLETIIQYKKPFKKYALIKAW